MNVACDKCNAIVLTEGVNISCTPPDTPNILITPSQTVTMMDESSSEDRYSTTVWVVFALVGLLLFLAIFAVIGIMIFFIHKKTKREKIAEFVKSRSALFFYSFVVIVMMKLFSVKRMISKWLLDTSP